MGIRKGVDDVYSDLKIEKKTRDEMGKFYVCRFDIELNYDVSNNKRFSNNKLFTFN